MQISIVLQNLGHGGVRDSEGERRDRWPLILERLADAAPDVLLLNECNHWDENGFMRLGRAARDLGLEALPLSPSRSGYATAMLYRREKLGPWRFWNPDFSDEFTHGMAIAGFDVGLPSLLTVGVAHITPMSKIKAVIEAETFAIRGYRAGPFGVLGADFNHPPFGSLASPEAMLTYNVARRFKDPLGDPPRVPNTDVAQIMAENGYVDAMVHLYGKTRNDRLLGRTGKSDRIDWILVTSPVAPALVNGRILDTPAEAANHNGVAATLDTDLINVENLWNYG
ncbi:endonuclease/exonuclease/phosphatase family protein [Nonomuraea sp. CA-143628]|uniref:endonuclease/exonuclease/phosphatase family protein n=1 Tax=Nonomuraea sp. CA-143628 TaxID=3239997 RepID=UPI003D8F4D3C